jgi:hypothetical protein
MLAKVLIERNRSKKERCKTGPRKKKEFKKKKEENQNQSSASHG